MTSAKENHLHIWLLHRERRIRQMEGEPYYRRLPECYRRRTQAVRILGGREGMVMKCQTAHILDQR